MEKTEDKFNTGETVYLDKDGKPVVSPPESEPLPEQPAEVKDKKGGK